ncbi:hypothetical protein GTZ99_05225 [Novosphingobium sp. FSY-8]|uniref:Tripartite tricarboxylate transporter TctB family protein n=1 Tax=Novosphingobium ovatum TaxID=1908523 RepID=A0ABW9XBP2_9SPHN|nr:hypothetical protein [Novosphingobium ovatum]NBC35954.1 hypothetical protein [Novosphingobium ovatum]
MDCATYIARETRVSIAINTVLSLVFFVAVFGLSGPVMVWGAGHYVFDFGPQAFMIGLMATLVPGALAAKARRSGNVEAYPTPSRLPRLLMVRALLLGAASAVAAVALAAAVLMLAGATQLPLIPALAAKLVFGAALAAYITPIGLKAALAA